MNTRVPLESAAVSDKGSRDVNEDAYLACEHPQEPTMLFVVSDGLGGQRDGALASQAVIDAAQTEFFALRRQMTARETLLHLLKAAHEAVRKLSAAGTQASVPDATVVMLLYRGGELTCAHLGDSRLYCVDEHGAKPLTVDHSVAVMMHSTLPPREDPDRARLVRTILSSPREEDVGHSIRVQATQVFLLCTDGLWQAVTNEKIHETFLVSRSSQEWTDSLRNAVLAVRDEDQDNFTALAVWPRERVERPSLQPQSPF